MKKYLAVLGVLCLSVSSFAQREEAREEEERSHKFRSDNIFLGGSIALGLGNGAFAAGGNPEIGYSIAEWLDAGISGNAIYNSITAESTGGTRIRSWNYGGGVFVRLFPLKEIFLQAVPEYNWISTKYKDIFSGYEERYLTSAPSLLLGIGYTSREIGSSSFYTVIMFDAGTNTNSPYIGGYGSKIPIIRSGFNIYLGRKRK